jgi:hypothetical protein
MTHDVQGITPTFKMYPCDPLHILRHNKTTLIDANLDRIYLEYNMVWRGSHGYT